MTTHRLAGPAGPPPSPPRYAIYWAPPGHSPLARLGNAWLGCSGAPDARTDGLPPRPAVTGFTREQLESLTAEPRRYALHGTLKPPFALADGRDVESLCADLARFASSQPPFIMPRLRLKPIGRRFLALIPSAPCPPLDALASRCVMDFDPYRRAASASELSRRRAGGLDAVEESNLLRWGYPYLLDRFRFHVTLTGPLDGASLERLQPPLAALFAPVTVAPVPVEDIALFIEPAPGQPFTLAKRFALTGQGSRWEHADNPGRRLGTP
jgi:uncharacterized protein DUF1045